MVDKLKRYGLKGVLLRLVWKSFSIFKIDCSQCYLLGKSLNEPQSSSQSNATFSTLEFVDFKKQRLLNPTWFTDEKISSIKKALEIEGSFAYGLLNNDLLISYGFLSLNYWGLDENLELEKGDCYLWDAYTHPSARGRKLHKMLTMHLEKEAFSKGKKRALSIVDSYNKASRNTYKRQGFSVVQKYFTINLFGVKKLTNFSYGK